MRKVNYRDLQYSREDYYFSKVKPIFDKLKKNHQKFDRKIQRQEEYFFNLLSNSVKIDQLDNIGTLIANINSHLETDFDINIFLYRSAVANAMCIPHYNHTENEKIEKLVILVSQHFLNNLSEEEQTTILGHELAHQLFGHVKIPVNMILEEKFNLTEVKELKSNVLKWSICCEITCDIFGYIANDKDQQTFSTAMLKYSTGFVSEIFDKLGTETWIDLMLTQFEDISKSIHKSVMSTHPLTPLRLKIVENISGSDLIQQYGTEHPEADIEAMKEEFSAIIDDTLDDIYPELFEDRKFDGKDIVRDLSIAVSMSDGKVSKDEIDCIGKILSETNGVKEKFIEVKKAVKDKSSKKVISQLITSAIHRVTSRSLIKQDIVNIVRQLVIVAASDSIISKDELETIHRFGGEFDITKQEIVLITKQLGF